MPLSDVLKSAIKAKSTKQTLKEVVKSGADIATNVKDAATGAGRTKELKSLLSKSTESLTVNDYKKYAELNNLGHGNFSGESGDPGSGFHYKKNGKWVKVKPGETPLSQLTPPKKRRQLAAQDISRMDKGGIYIRASGRAAARDRTEKQQSDKPMSTGKKPPKPQRRSYESKAKYEYALKQWTQRYGSKNVGDLNFNGTKRWNGSEWVKVNVVRHGQRAKLGGKPVYADGKGNWRLLEGVSNDGRKHGKVVATYEVGKDRGDIKAKTGSAPKEKERKPQVANIPKQEGPINNPQFGKPGSANKDSSASSSELTSSKQTSRRTRVVAPAVDGSGRRAVKPKQSTKAAAPRSSARATDRSVTGGSRKSAAQLAYAKDARNRQYDQLRKAGKTKEAEALGKQIAADHAAKAPKNPYRAPQGAERKDTLSKQVAEMRSRRGSSHIAKSSSPKPKPAEKQPNKRPLLSSQPPATGAAAKKKLLAALGALDKKKKSAANAAGWQGNRNY